MTIHSSRTSARANDNDDKQGGPKITQKCIFTQHLVKILAYRKRKKERSQFFLEFLTTVALGRAYHYRLTVFWLMALHDTARCRPQMPTAHEKGRQWYSSQLREQYGYKISRAVCYLVSITKSASFLA